MIDKTNLSSVSWLAIDLCEDLGIPYSFGKGYATLDGVPMEILYHQDIFKPKSQCDIDPVPFDFFMKYYVFDDIEQELQKERLLKLLEAGRTIKYEGTRAIIAFENFDLVLEEKS